MPDFMNIEQRLKELEKKIDNPILGDNIPEDARYEPGLIQEISELKKQTKTVFLMEKMRRERLEEVLRDLFKGFEENHDESIHRDFFTGLLKKLDGDKEPTDLAGSARQTEDIRWLWRHASHDDDIETLEEYNKKMIELEEKYLTEDADEQG